MPPPSTEPARWFAEEVQPHESSLRAYLRGAFPSVRDVDDVVQESYLRVWRTRLAQPVRSARAFLFKVSRHHALDLVRRAAIAPVEAVGDLERLPVIDDEHDLVAAFSKREKIRLLAEAIDRLPLRCREIVVLRKLECLPQKQVAARLGLSEKTIEEQVARGERRCADFLRRHGVRTLYGNDGA